MIEGRPALIVIDIQAETFHDRTDEAIPTMPDYAARMLQARRLVDAARETDVPVVFIQEVHRPDGIDFGRELDGDEEVHCIETEPGTDIAVAEMDFRPNDYLIKKRRYSAFFGTDFEILLKGLRAETLILCGGLTDVCVHYTFVDGHESDYFCRVVEDCVAGSSEYAHEASLRAMEYLQTGARCSLDAMLESMADYARSVSNAA
ncbi:MAG: cysteine hydrolase [Pseudomonadota bacterium]